MHFWVTDPGRKLTWQWSHFDNPANTGPKVIVIANWEFFFFFFFLSGKSMEVVNLFILVMVLGGVKL